MSIDAIAMRFRAERQRLGLSHARIATLCGVAKTSVIAWEKGSKIPANALAAIEQADPQFDASFVLSGERSWSVAPGVDAGARIRAARERLGLNQTEFGEIGGVTLRTQQNYESGRRAPTLDYLTRLAAAGIDTAEIIGTTHPPMTLSAAEVALIEALRALPPEQQEQIRLQVHLLQQHAQRLGESETTPTGR